MSPELKGFYKSASLVDDIPDISETDEVIEPVDDITDCKHIPIHNS